MHKFCAGFLLDECGRELAIDRPDLAEKLGLIRGLDAVDFAVRQLGFVLVQPAHHAIFVELCQISVAPLAALEACYRIKEITTDCVVLAFPQRKPRCPRYELVPTPEAIQRLEKYAQTAQRKAAVKLQRRSLRPRLFTGRRGTERTGKGTVLAGCRPASAIEA